MGHITTKQLTEIKHRYNDIHKAAIKKGLDTSVTIALYGSPDEEQIFDSVSVRVEVPGAEESLYYNHTTCASDRGWGDVLHTLDKATETVNNYHREA